MPAEVTLDSRTRQFTIRGHVQGVGFRYFVVRHARRLGLRGYTQNRPDGSVEVVAVGSDAALDALATRLQQGPPAAQVDSVESSRPSATREYDGFDVL
jgi:acylphosphatase